MPFFFGRSPDVKLFLLETLEMGTMNSSLLSVVTH